MGHEPADAVVLGGGPAGLSAAIALAGRGLRTIVLTLARNEGDRVGESHSPAAGPLLRELGVWEAFVADGHAPCFGNSSAWGSGELRHHDFLRDPLGQAWHIDRRRFESRLAERAASAGATIVLTPRSPHCERISDRWCVSVGAGGDLIETRFLLDATGRSSWLGRRCGARRIDEDRQVALVAFLEAQAGPLEDTTTLVEAVDRGWWYSAALPDGRLVTTFMTDHDLLPPGSTDADHWFSLLAAAPHTRRRLAEGCYRPGSPVRVVAASSGRLAPMTGPGWAAIGDAAMCYDPLASHGLTVALASGRDAAEAVSAQLSGELGAIDRFSARLSDAFAGYTAMRLDVYRAERRWPNALYWQRRLRQQNQADGVAETLRGKPYFGAHFATEINSTIAFPTWNGHFRVFHRENAMAESIKQKAEDAGHKVAEKAKDVGASVAQKASDAGHKVAEKATQAGNAVGEKVGEATNWAKDKAHQAGEKIEEAGDAAKKKIDNAAKN
jgi:flavin-dependent dehydrogenase